MIAVTDEPVVTDETRFWLYWEWRPVRLIYGSSGAYERAEAGEPHRYRAEVSEAAYRRAYSEQWDLPTDITHPLDDYWWSHRTIAGGWPHRWSIEWTYGGVIDWWGENG